MIATLAQELLSQGSDMWGRTAPEPRECHFEHDRVARRSIESRHSLLDLADDHVRAIGHAAKDGIGNGRPLV